MRAKLPLACSEHRTRNVAPGAEKKQKKDQKEEAERHQALQQDLDETRAALYTWQVGLCLQCSVCAVQVKGHAGSCFLIRPCCCILCGGLLCNAGKRVLFALAVMQTPTNALPSFFPQIYHLDQDAKDEEGAVRTLREQLAEAERSQQASAGWGWDATAGFALECKRRLWVGITGPSSRAEWTAWLKCRHNTAAAVRSCSRSPLRLAEWAAGQEAAGQGSSRAQVPASASPPTALPHRNFSQVAERAAEEKKREQAGLQKERLLLEKKAKKKQADADKRVGAGERHALGRTDSRCMMPGGQVATAAF